MHPAIVPGATRAPRTTPLAKPFATARTAPRLTVLAGGRRA
ncbi:MULTISPECIES: hypothetical protein [Streptomyces]|uniref:Uncharacterized protein n=1 Tax=Streptomyces albireticuli TaxID=1940 RepID=A0A1Z2LA92_9ACTN|nr:MULTISPECIES: hypothetical protein [Streptomyces]ARZ71207.1 hypothetical protein SMD11_5628 [Streptomyces albireticuli]